MPRRLAVDFAHIQWNRETTRRWLLLDLDRADAAEAFDDASLPAPNLVMIKSSRGTAHYAYELAAPVTYYERSREAPQRLFNVVERAYTLQLRANLGYAGFLAKTAYHPDWITVRYHDKPFELRELAAHIDVDAVIKKARGAPEMGMGRNVIIFNELRLIAYSEVRRFKRDGAEFSAYCSRLIAIAAGLNTNPAFLAPLHHKEVAGIARSVAKWTWRRFSNETFSKIQSARGNRGMASRWEGHVSAESIKPWVAAGVSRATWYRRKA